jgi:hypothetical protein
VARFVVPAVAVRRDTGFVITAGRATRASTHCAQTVGGSLSPSGCPRTLRGMSVRGPATPDAETVAERLPSTSPFVVRAEPCRMG